MKKVFLSLTTAAICMCSITVFAQNISTFAGNNAMPGYTGDGGPATAAGLNGPTACTFDAAGNMYLSDKYNNAIRKIATDGTITTIAGNGTAGNTGDGGAATAATLNYPLGINLDATGNLYIADYSNHAIRRISTTGIMSMAAGCGVWGYAGDGDAATTAKISYPSDVAFDAAGNMYISDWNNGVVRKVNTHDTISTFAGGGSSYADGIPATDASFYANNSVFADAAGNIYVADMNDNRICKITAAGLCYTICGDGTAGYTGDGGPATAARLSGPSYVIADNAGNVFISDHYNHAVRKIDAAGNISTIAGTGSNGYSGDGGAATAAKLYYPVGLCFDKSGNLYIAEQSNNVIRKIEAIPITLSGTTTLCKSATSPLSAGGTGGVWSSSNTAVATVSSSGVVTGVSAGTAIISYSQSLGLGTTSVTINNCGLSANTIVSETTFAVFPNPSAGAFTIVLPVTTEESTVTLSNMLGEVIMTRKANALQKTVSMSGIATGNYVIKVATGEHVYRTKIVVNK